MTYLFTDVTSNKKKTTLEAIKDVVPWTKNKIKRSLTKKTLYKRVPVFRWLPQYNLEWAVGDLVAGITVGLTIIPQALAYSSIAGLPPQVSEQTDNVFLH